MNIKTFSLRATAFATIIGFAAIFIVPAQDIAQTEMSILIIDLIAIFTWSLVEKDAKQNPDNSRGNTVRNYSRRPKDKRREQKRKLVPQGA